MSGLVVIHTGPADHADRWVGVLRNAGFEVRGLPAIASAPIELTSEALQEIDAGGPYGLVVVTSPRAAGSLAALRGRLAGAELAAVGSATAKACENAGFPARWVGSTGRRTFLEALAARIEFAGMHVLHPHGDLAQDAHLPEVAGRGARVVAPVVYRTVAVEHCTDEVRAAMDRASGVTFTSPSGVRSFCAAADAAGAGRDARALFAATLGPATEQCAQKAGFSWRGISRRPDPAGVTSLLATALKSRIHE